VVLQDFIPWGKRPAPPDVHLEGDEIVHPLEKSGERCKPGVAGSNPARGAYIYFIIYSFYLISKWLIFCLFFDLIFKGGEKSVGGT
jgi:hypothetical protein